MASLETIRKITIQASVQGVDQAAHSVERFGQSMDDLGDSSQSATKEQDAFRVAVEKTNRSLSLASRSVDQIGQAQKEYASAQRAANDNLNEASRSLFQTGAEALTLAAHLKGVVAAVYLLSPAFRGLVNTTAVEAFKTMAPAAAATAAAVGKSMVPAFSSLLAFVSRIGPPILAVVAAWEALNAVTKIGSERLAEVADLQEKALRASGILMPERKEVISTEEVAQANELNDRMNAATKLIEERWLPLKRDLVELGVEYNRTWVRLLELIAQGVGLLQTFYQWAKDAGDETSKAINRAAAATNLLPTPATHGIPGGVMVVPDATPIEKARDALRGYLSDQRLVQQQMRQTEDAGRLFRKELEEQKKTVGGTSGEFERMVRSIERHIAAQEGEIAAIGGGVGEVARLRTEHRLLEAAQQDGIAITEAVKKQIDDLAKRAGAAAQSLAELQAKSRAEFELKIVLFSPEEQRIARELRQLFGESWTKHMNDDIANVMRLTDAIKQLKDASTQFVTSFIQGMVQGESASKSFANALSGLSSTLISQGLTQTMGGNPFGLAMAGIGIGLGIFSSKMKKQQQQAEEAKRKAEEAAQKLKEAQEAWAAMQDEYNKFLGALAGTKRGGLAETLAGWREQMEKFIKAAQEAKAGTGGMMEQVTEGARRLLREIAAGTPVLGEFEQRLRDATTQFDGLSTELARLGISAEESAELIRNAFQTTLDQLRQSITRDLAREVNELADKGWINQLTDILKKFNELSVNNLADPAVLSQWVTLALQKAVDQAQLTGSAFEEMLAVFPELIGRVHEFTGAAIRSAADLAKAASALEDRMFAATVDTSSLAGALAEFDRKALREVQEEVAAGGENIVLLEQVLAAERLAVIRRFADQAAQEQQRVMEDAIKTLDQFTKSVRQFVTSLRTGPGSPLSPQARLATAQTEFDRLMAVIQGGTAQERRTAMDEITNAASTLLEAGKAFDPAGFPVMFEDITSSLEALPEQISVQELILAELQNNTAVTQAMSEAISMAVGGNLDALRSLLSAWLPSIDQNTDKAISFQEMLDAFGTTYNTGTLSALFDAMDQNRDGILTLNELQSANNQQVDESNATLVEIQKLSEAQIMLQNSMVTLQNTLAGLANAQYQLTYNSYEILTQLATINQSVLAQTQGTYGTNHLLWVIAQDLGMLTQHEVGWYQPLARGGFVNGPGTGTSDSIAARLSAGEYVVNAAATSRHLKTLEAINNGYARGGFVANDNEIMIDELRQLRMEVNALRRVSAAGHAAVAEGVDMLVGAAQEQTAHEKLRSARS